MPTSRIGRRSYLRVIGGSIATAGVAETTASATTAAKVTISGELESYDGNTVSGQTVYLTYGSGSNTIKTDNSGSFETSIESNSTVSLGLYNTTAAKDGVPHIDGLGSYDVDSSNTDIGTISIERGYLVNLQAINNDGDPVSNAEFHVRADGYGRTYRHANDSGYMYINNGADFTGLELAESVKVTIVIPGNSDGEADKKYQETIYVDSPMTVTAREGEGTTIKEQKPTETTTTTQTTTETTTSTTTTTATPTTTTETTATTTKTTVSTTPPTTIQSTEKAMSTNGTETPSKRGFLSNGESTGDYEFLTNPFHLTVGGFILSVAGIAHNLLWGR